MTLQDRAWRCGGGASIWWLLLTLGGAHRAPWNTGGHIAAADRPQARVLTEKAQKQKTGSRNGLLADMISIQLYYIEGGDSTAFILEFF